VAATKRSDRYGFTRANQLPVPLGQARAAQQRTGRNCLKRIARRVLDAMYHCVLALSETDATC
jgi:hypothetical protein